jgi:hypothetical protein
MKTKWKKLWVRALRGGKYKQGQSCLRDNTNNTCCLGVLCDLVDPKGWSVSDDSYYYEYLGDDSFAPDILLKKVGLSREEMSTLASLNDNRKSFQTIADYIEKNL